MRPCKSPTWFFSCYFLCISGWMDGTINLFVWKCHKAARWPKVVFLKDPRLKVMSVVSFCHCSQYIPPLSFSYFCFLPLSLSSWLQQHPGVGRKRIEIPLPYLPVTFGDSGEMIQMGRERAEFRSCFYIPVLSSTPSFVAPPLLNIYCRKIIPRAMFMGCRHNFCWGLPHLSDLVADICHVN